jgi:hypothetical protein
MSAAAATAAAKQPFPIPLVIANLKTGKPAGPI